ncbi:MAG: nucleoside deaminase [Phycisphaerales bacterium]
MNARDDMNRPPKPATIAPVKLPGAWAAGLDAAIEQAERSWDQGGIPIGAVLLARDGSIVARGHNRRVQDGSTVMHAEIACMHEAGRRDDWHTLTLVSTLSPCIMCTGAALLHRVPVVVAGENVTFRGADHLLREAGVEVHVVNDPRCIGLMQRMQRERPELWAEDIGYPDDPAHPAHPAHPARPARPAHPANPADPAGSAGPGDPDGSGESTIPSGTR